MFIGRGVGFPTALEGALKLKEISYIHAEGFPAGELKHGSIALLDPDTPLVAIATDSHVYGKVVSNVQEVRAATLTSSSSPLPVTRPSPARRLRLLRPCHVRLSSVPC